MAGQHIPCSKGCTSFIKAVLIQPMQTSAIIMIEAFQRYRDQWQGEGATVSHFESFLHTHANAFERTNEAGHFTGSAWLVSADGMRVLLMHHRKLDRWLQPGGHADGDGDLARVALREAREETGLADSQLDGDIFDIDRHRIPARGGEPEHWHYDVRYVVRAGANESFVANAESRGLAWRLVAEVADDETLDTSLRRMARKWLANV
jgi:8-oxo-dGTP pyrophosphatase MutT (NUDIX family)